MLARSGRRAGRRLIPPTASNPTGFFESLDVNARNDEVLDTLTIQPGATAPPADLRWLAAYSGPAASRTPLPALAQNIPARPWVLKDPRFTYTYPVWEQALGDHEVVVLVRHPGEVVDSVGAMARREPSTFARWNPSAADIVHAWLCAYRAVDRWADATVVWLAHDSLGREETLAALSGLVGSPLDGDLIDPGLDRSRRSDVPAAALQRWEVLRERCSDAGVSRQRSHTAVAADADSAR